ncbi:alpha/beta hydrolase fold domain-containing protein [Rhodococcus opacus]|uniref:alpha/beta hydrolase n=1 Tax=Rhodococcus opacus TaxID=37919 RepID=UPI0002A40419|nr:alpha/beta hydrolase fold domain-containing protein [Rhodococcus opacus]ELB86188.1 alpha/beta hydrolase [Rhodococcus wratislaviensis IFP 2016]MDX5970103.1 alpha/beta hydrolase fold domain-containing protein [Rhodococcus opacus]CAG7633764.1 hypothetical protein E143388_07534 [Rhodococcus opacus]
MTDSFASEEIPIRPPIDPELLPAMGAMQAIVPPFGNDTLAELRELLAKGLPGQAPVDYTAAGEVLVEEHKLPGSEPGVELVLAVLKPTTGSGPWPLIYHTHGGGMVIGTRYTALEQFLPYVLESRAVVASIEYRLAPEHPDPAPVTDCYTGLTWSAENATLLDIDPEHIIITGSSAGGGLAAGTALIARDRGFPRLTHQILNQPMLDDRITTHSARMLEHEGIWDRNDNLFGWTSLLASILHASDVSL